MSENKTKQSEANSAATAIRKLAQSSYIGASQMFIVFALTHPLDLLKTRMQADIQHKLTGIHHTKAIYSQSGLAGFYKAGVPNFTRALIKEMYRSSLRGFFNKLYADSLPHTLKQSYPDLKNLLTGITMSTADTLIASPLERIKVWLMTSNERKPSMLQFFKRNETASALASNLFSGLNATFCRNTISWVSYLVAEERIRHLVVANKYANDESVSIMDQLVIGTFSGMLNCFITLPFDSVKTQIQKKDSVKTTGIMRTMQLIVDTKGLAGLYSGWQFRLPSYIIVAIITSSNIQRIDRIWSDQVPFYFYFFFILYAWF